MPNQKEIWQKETWRLSVCSKHCYATNKAFEDNEPIVTALFLNPESGSYSRRDWSESAWDSLNKEELNHFSFWHSTYQRKAKGALLQEVENSIEAEFRRSLAEVDSSEESIIACYLLALLLERRKGLVEKDVKAMTRADGSPYWVRVYEFKSSNEVCFVEDPDIDLNSIDETQSKFVRYFDFLKK